MLSIHHLLDLRLAPFVRCIWIYRDTDTSRQRLLPTGTTELVINLLPGPVSVLPGPQEPTLTFGCGTVVSGPHSRFFMLDAEERVAALGVHFHPGGARQILGLPLAELTDIHCSLEDLWGPDARRLRAQLLECSTDTDRLRLVQAGLLAQLDRADDRNPYVSYALDRFMNDPAAIRVGLVAKETGYSTRQFSRMFLDTVGLHPKRFCRIMRLQEAIRHASSGARPDWTDIALASGYCDQSHLVRDFRHMTGLSPSQYEPLNEDSPNHVIDSI